MTPEAIEQWGASKMLEVLSGKGNSLRSNKSSPFDIQVLADFIGEGSHVEEFRYYVAATFLREAAKGMYPVSEHSLELDLLSFPEQRPRSMTGMKKR